MTVSIQSYNKDFVRHCEILFEFYGYTINPDYGDILVIDYDLWEKTIKYPLPNTLVVVLSYIESDQQKLPPDVVFFTRPVDTDIMIEYIIKVHKEILKNEYLK